MDRLRTRAKQQLPAVMLTLLSIIQALALELLWTRLLESPHLWGAEGPVVATAGWIQFLAMFLGVVQVWLFYASLVMRLSWLPAMRELVLPFVIGLLEFTLIALAGPGLHGWWFAVLAVIFAVSIGEGHAIFRRARREPENEPFFRHLNPAGVRDFVPGGLTVAVLLAFGVAVPASGGWEPITLTGLVLANALLAWPLRDTWRYWNLALGPTDEQA